MERGRDAVSVRPAGDGWNPAAAQPVQPVRSRPGRPHLRRGMPPAPVTAAGFRQYWGECIAPGPVAVRPAVPSFLPSFRMTLRTAATAAGVLLAATGARAQPAADERRDDRQADVELRKRLEPLV